MPVCMEATGGRLGTQHRKTRPVSVVHSKCPFCHAPPPKPSLARQGLVSPSEIGREVASGDRGLMRKMIPSPSHLPLLQTLEAYYSPRSLLWLHRPLGTGCYLTHPTDSLLHYFISEVTRWGPRGLSSVKGLANIHHQKLIKRFLLWVSRSCKVPLLRQPEDSPVDLQAPLPSLPAESGVLRGWSWFMR